MCVCFFKLILTITTLRYRFRRKLSWLTFHGRHSSFISKQFCFDITSNSILKSIFSFELNIVFCACFVRFLIRTVFVRWARNIEFQRVMLFWAIYFAIQMFDFIFLELNTRWKKEMLWSEIRRFQASTRLILDAIWLLCHSGTDLFFNLSYNHFCVCWWPLCVIKMYTCILIEILWIYLCEHTKWR